MTGREARAIPVRIVAAWTARLGAGLAGLAARARSRAVPEPALLEPSARPPGRLRRVLLGVRRHLRPERDDATMLPRRIPPRVWILTVVLVTAVYLFMWSVVHVVADCRPCLGHLDDPLQRIIPQALRWQWVARQLYVLVTLLTLAAMVLVAVAGDHRPAVRWGMALAIGGILRCATVWLVPLCPPGVPIGTRVMTEIPWHHIGSVRFAWDMFASNDFLFSGHVEECLLALFASRSFPRPVRAGLWLFLVIQAYALLATRDHYTVDILVAIPMAVFVDRVALRALGHLSRREEAARSAQGEPADEAPGCFPRGGAGEAPAGPVQSWTPG